MRPPLSLPPCAGTVRVNGLVVLVGVVLLGVGSGAGYLHWKRPRIERESEARLAQALTTVEGRLAEWFRYGAPQIHHRLTNFARFSAERPWLVTHAMADPDGGPPELWGLRVDEFPDELARIEGTTVVIELPAPRPLGRLALHGDHLNHVPIHDRAPDEAACAARLEELVRWFLEGLPQALEEDIEGVRMRIVVRPRGTG